MPPWLEGSASSSRMAVHWRVFVGLPPFETRLQPKRNFETRIGSVQSGSALVYLCNRYNNTDAHPLEF